MFLGCVSGFVLYGPLRVCLVCFFFVVIRGLFRLCLRLFERCMGCFRVVFLFFLVV